MDLVNLALSAHAEAGRGGPTSDWRRLAAEVDHGGALICLRIDVPTQRGGTTIENVVKRAAVAGQLGAVGSGSRQRPDGVTLQWEFTDPTAVVADGLVPFFIDGGSSPHPAATAAPGPMLVSLRAEHPEPERVRDALSVVGVELPTEPGPRPALIATLRGELGESELR